MTQVAGGVIDDAGLKTKRPWIDVPVNLMSVDGSWQSLGAGTHAIGEAGVVAAEQNGLPMDTADEIYGRFHPPWQMDLNHDLMAQVFAIVQEASKANIDFTLHCKGVKAGEAESDAKVSADGSIVFPALSNTLAGELVKTPIMGLGVGNVFLLDDWIQFAVTLADKGTATADNVHLVKVRFHFTAALTDPSGVRQTT
ncbi:MAG: hypothetical protein ACYTAN_12775 [Planctomycetota bacterium]|jgi:hypothetical protein